MEPGYQAVQSMHAIAGAILKFPDEAKKWHQESDYLVLLAVKDLAALVKVILDLEKTDIKHYVFREPDVGDEPTAVALMPSDAAKIFCKGFKLALRPTKASKPTEVRAMIS